MIKLTSGGTKVLTKTVNGVVRVSCSCCAGVTPDCCMYSAVGLGTIYSESDLPDTVNVYDGQTSRTYTKVGGAFVAAGAFNGEDIVLSVDSSGGTPVWQFTVDGSQILGDYDGPCLINALTNDDSVGNPIITDNFEDFYEITLDSPALQINPAITVVQRVDLCLWTSDAANLYFIDSLTSENYGWLVEFSEAETEKKASQDSPEGQYTIPPGNLHEGGTITVAAA
jgi:hypothetical protein